MKLPVPPDAEGLYLTVTALATFDRTRFADGDHIRIDSELDAFSRGSTIHEAHTFSDVVLDLKDCDGAAPPALPEAPPLPPGVPAPGPDADVGSCLVVEGGDVECDPLNPGIYIYKMGVDASHAGQMIELAPTTPGIGVFPPSQVVPAGGGVLEWSIDGAAPGMTVEFIVNGFHTDIIGHVSGPREGLGLCCATEFKIVIPVGDCPPPPCPGPGCPPPPPPPCEGADCPPPPPPPGELEPNIQVVKDATVTSCTLDGNCTFHIVVTNTGPGIYSGPLAIDDWTTPDLIPTTGITFDPSPPWTYGIAADGTPFFLHPSVTLGIGDSRDLTVTFAPGPDWPADAINNCARFNYPQSEHAPFGDPNDDRDCEVIPICVQGQCPGEEPPQGGEPQLAIAKDLISDDGTTCSLQADGRASCVFKVTITNTGSAPQTGPIVLTDAFPTGPVESFDWEPKATWTCAEDGGPDRYRCEYSGPALPPGAEMLLVIQAVVASDNPAREVQNCAALEQTPPAGDCATGDLPQAEAPPSEGAADLKLDKSCEPLDDLGRFKCTLTVTNTGTAAPSGTVTLVDETTNDPGGTPILANQVTPDAADLWTCADEPANQVSCTIDGAQLGPDQSHHVDIEFQISPGQTGYKNCVEGLNTTDDVHTFANKCVSSEPEAKPKEDEKGEKGEEGEKGKCASGMVLNDKGLCACPEGSTWNGRRCAGAPETPAPPPPPPPAPTCEQKGMIGDWPDCKSRPERKRCPKDWIGDYEPDCKKPTCEQKGMIGDWPDCKSTPEPVPCPKGWKGKYQPNCTKPTCQEQGMVGDWPNCQKLVPCPKGWKGKYQPNCTKPTCQEQGMVGDWPNCQKLVPCPKGWKGKYQPNCTKPTCQEQGMVGNWPNCQKLVRCPKGWKGKYQPNCTKPTCQEQGMVGNWPNCQRLVRCPKGWKGKYQPNCTKPTCQEQGMVGNWPNCKKLVPCPKGWKGKYQPNCTPPQNPQSGGSTGCPKGQYFSQTVKKCVPFF